MRKKILNLFNFLLKHLAKATIKKYNPRIIGITGSVGKTTTKDAIYTVLKSAGLQARATGGNLNNETGMPLVILGDYKRSGGALFLTGAILRGLFNLIRRNRNYPKILILEYSADKPGDLDYLISIARPDMAVVTAIGQTPVHIEFYQNVEQVILEKSKLVEAVRPGGNVILNADDPDVAGMANRAKAKVKTYGFTDSADVELKDFRNKTNGLVPIGTGFSIKVSGESVPVEMRGVLGKSGAYATGAATVAGIIVGLTLGEINKALLSYKGEKGRTKIIEGIKETYIIDDTYNASPESTKNALDILKSLRAKRKIIVMGDMLELGEHSEAIHKEIGEIVARVAHVLITVGPYARLLGETAIRKGLPDDDVYFFDKSGEAGLKLNEILDTGDLILVKGSQSMRMERVVKSIMKNPQEASRILVRQYGKWLKS
ncbi:UDP-N-acetylmuramoyl-tripeptide--D-alanyl-D-alanine ligase [Patescibacteria group bacterium]|nr:UDP-N-acetylmuramoyl-tripeptide--D-alanyl-D-alanine ligase [Patescibacteria group bacterium]